MGGHTQRRLLPVVAIAAVATGAVVVAGCGAQPSTYSRAASMRCLVERPEYADFMTVAHGQSFGLYAEEFSGRSTTPPHEALPAILVDFHVARPENGGVGRSWHANVFFMRQTSDARRFYDSATKALSGVFDPPTTVTRRARNVIVDSRQRGIPLGTGYLPERFWHVITDCLRV